MNHAFYGHTNTIVFTYTQDGKFNKTATAGGMRMIYDSVNMSMSLPEFNVYLNVSEGNAGDDAYRRDYYGLRQIEAADGTLYDEAGRYLGYEEGTGADNIFSVLPEENAPIDILFVWDGGYGGLNIPDAANVLWASDKAMPDRERFSKIADKCFLFLDGNILRKAGAMISRQISWERTVSELVTELQSNPAINYLQDARQLLISFGVDGAVFILPKGRNGSLEASLILTTGEVEGAIGSKKPGQASNIYVFSLMATTLVTAMARFSAALAARGLKTNDVFGASIDTFITLLSQRDYRTTTAFEHAESDAVKWGGVMRTILESAEHVTLLSGILLKNKQTGEAPKRSMPKLKDWPAFPIPLIRGKDFYQVPEDWTVINSVGKQILDVAVAFVQNGAAAIEGLPRFSLGALTTVDRWEIESYQNVRNLILDYASADSVRPLSIAVFGSPGSGKSFGVTQIAMNILPGKIEKLEFNVSQFFGPHSLSLAFQKVRDVILEGKLPLVFFDEFDSDKDGTKLGWIKSFLMPMQDGRFSDESGDHPLGKCILVFAGGTAATFESFSAPLYNDDGDLAQTFKDVKGPDFVSRLKGTINILGPNPVDKNDQNYILRRSLLLRSLCERKLAMKEGVAPISPRIIRAMLLVPQFRHGARSMEAILDMSRIEGGTWESAALPFRSQLALHVDAGAFLDIVKAYVSK